MAFLAALIPAPYFRMTKYFGSSPLQRIVAAILNPDATEAIIAAPFLSGTCSPPTR